MAEKEYDPLARIRTLERILPFLSVLMLPIIPVALWGIFGFIAMDWDLTKWKGESRFFFVFLCVALWLIFIIATKEFCEKKLKYSRY